MIKQILFFLFLTSLSVHANAEAVDYSYCSDYFNKVRANFPITGFNFPFEVDANGKIIDTNPNVNKIDIDKNTREYSFTEKNPKHVTHIFTITTGSNEVVEQVKYDQLFHLSDADKQFYQGTMPEEASSIIYLDFKDGKCFPSFSVVEQAFGDKYLESTLFDTQLCRDINQFFKDNKDAAACFDGKSKINKKMLALFSKNNFDQDRILREHYQMAPQSNNYGLSVEQRMIMSNPAAAPQVPTHSYNDRQTLFKLLGDNPLLSAHRILMDCYEKGLGRAINDDELFKSQVKLAPAKDDSASSVDSD